ncbi:DMT family transporter [Phaeobacter sp. 22II1-1F12B]|uniref:DMT family transporter n=1 Tax=Phaeobacter sp. 22II1-1F12B TaxID=1317111 RepID=UPI001E600E60|nr:DMT family transporter [Phaeobacter sp. 22II1-1F12B]
MSLPATPDMPRRELLFFTGMLVLIGAGWGLTQPLGKIAVSTGHRHFGLIFWQLVIGTVAFGAVSLAQRRRLPFNRDTLRVYLVVALAGTIIPNSASYQAIAHLPSGVLSILLSLVPMLAFPMALALGLEKFAARRLLGLLAGLAGVLLLILPDASLPDAAMLAWVPLGLVAPLFYAFEGNYVARWGTAGLDPIRVLFGASLVGAIMALPLALATGQFISPLRPYGAPEWALIGSALIHVVVYAGYVWLVGRAGAVFAVQVSYVVTGFGVFWAMQILGETYSPYIWAALGIVLAGVMLVQPRRNEAVAEQAAIGENTH